MREMRFSIVLVTALGLLLVVCTPTADIEPTVESLAIVTATSDFRLRNPGPPTFGPEKWTGGKEIADTANSADMLAVGNDGFSGKLHLIQIERKTKVTVTLDNAGLGPFSAAIRRGGCPDEGNEPSGQFDYLLFNVVNGHSVSMVNTPAQFFQFSVSYVVVVEGQDLENDPVISCGNIPSPLR